MTSRSEFQLGSPAPTAAIVALVVLMVATLTAVVRNRPVGAARPLAETEPEPEPVEAPEEPSIAAPIEAPMAAALIDAIPWGRIERIEGPGGEPGPLPDTNETPVLLELPPGEWRVVLSNPSSTGERTCVLSLTAGQRHDCLVEFERLSVDQYFREAGWWR